MHSPDQDPLGRRPAKRPAQQSSVKFRQRNTSDAAFYAFPTSLGPAAPIYPNNGSGQCHLPLDVLSVIIGYLWDSPADLAVISRVSRIMHYLATPLLYREVRLRGTGLKANGGEVDTVVLGGGEARHSKGKKRKRDSEDEFNFRTGRGGSENGANQTVSKTTSCPGTASAVGDRGMSVFLVGLATLQRPTVSKVVRKLVFEGELEVGSFGNDIGGNSSSTDTEKTPRTLKWGESDGMFGLAVGGTVGTLTDLQEFSWKLKNAYIHPMLWYSLARHATLSSLTYLCPPSTTIPPWTHIPTTYVPAFQNLTSLSVLDIDGSHPPDDFSRVVFGSPGIENLETLRLSWVDGNEYEKQKGAEVGGGLVSVFPARVMSLAASLGGNAGDGQPAIKKLALKKLELMNLYIPPGDLSMEYLFDHSTIEFLTYLNCSIFDSWPTIFSTNLLSTTTATDSPASISSFGTTTTLSSSTSNLPFRPLPSLTTLRTDSLHPPTLHLLSHTHSLQNIYLLPPPQHPLRPVPPSLTNTLLTALYKNHLPTLHRLLLPPHLILSKSDCSKLILHAPPTIVEFAIATERTEWHYLNVLVPFLTNLACFRLLRAPEVQALKNITGGLFRASEPEIEKMERRLGESWKGSTLRVLGVGDCLWKVDKTVSLERKKRVWGGGGGMDGPSLLLPSQRLRRGDIGVEELKREIEEGPGGESTLLGRDEDGDGDGDGQGDGGLRGRRGMGVGVGVGVNMASEEWESTLKQLDEEFIRRETTGDIPKRKTRMVGPEEVLSWGIIREGRYGIFS